ncbi:MAG: DUF4124 domain-containing protein [Candidatus Binatia bacterium]
MRTLLALGLGIIFATGVAAQAIQEWQTPDGKPFFGDRPPPGSVPVKKIDKPIGTVSAPPIRTSARRPVARRGYVWRDGVQCQDLTVVDLKEVRFDGISRRIVRGTVKHDGRHLVRNVQICGAGVCETLRAGKAMKNGDREDFYLDIPSAQPIPPRIECSIREPRG